MKYCFLKWVVLLTVSGLSGLSWAGKSSQWTQSSLQDQVGNIGKTSHPRGLILGEYAPTSLYNTKKTTWFYESSIPKDTSRYIPLIYIANGELKNAVETFKGLFDVVLISADFLRYVSAFYPASSSQIALEQLTQLLEPNKGVFFLEALHPLIFLNHGIEIAYEATSYSIPRALWNHPEAREKFLRENRKMCDETSREITYLLLKERFANICVHELDVHLYSSYPEFDEFQLQDIIKAFEKAGLNRTRRFFSFQVRDSTH